MQKRLKDCRVAVVGLGLMGASLCMDLTRGGLCREVRGIARRTDTVLEAFFSGAVDLATNDLNTGVLGADIVVLATPVRTILSMLEEIGPLLWPGCLVIDMGSTKAEICAAMERLPHGIQPVGGHPMTGKETAGFSAAEPGLYQGAPWAITPLARTSQESLDLAHELVHAVGAQPILLTPASRPARGGHQHLPIASRRLVHAVTNLGDQDPLVWDLAAGGFRDTSRVAASDTRMFLDILMTNREAVLDQIYAMLSHLQSLRAALADGDECELNRRLSASQARRSAWRPRTRP